MRHSASRHTATRQIISVLIVALLALSGCGISTDERSEALPSDTIPETLRPGRLPTPTPVANLGGEFQTIYMVGPNDRVFEVFREVPAEPDAVIDSLFFGTTNAEKSQGIGSAITRSTQLAEAIDFNPLFQLATVTLTPDSLQTNSRDQLLGFGQIVFTLTELEGIESVLFETKRGDVAESLRVQTDKGLSQAGTQVRRADYASIDPATTLIAFPDDDAETPIPTPTPQGPTGPLAPLPIWLLNSSNELVPVTRQAERTGASVVEALLDGLVFEEEEQQLRSAIRPVAELRGVNVVDETAVVDLSADSLPPFEAGDDRALAVAQIVFTLTGLAEIDSVVFTIDGVPTSMPTQDGIAANDLDGETVGLQRFDFALYAPDIAVPGPTPTPTPTPTVDPEAIAEDPDAIPTDPEPTPGEP